LNSRKIFDKTKLRSAYGKLQQEQDAALRKWEIMTLNICWIGKGSKLPFERGIICAINSCKELFQDLRKEGIEYLLTSK